MNKEKKDSPEGRQPQPPDQSRENKPEPLLSEVAQKTQSLGLPRLKETLREGKAK